MATNAVRDRLSVDLRGLGPALVHRAKLTGESPSAVVRRLLADALRPEAKTMPLVAEPWDRACTKVSLRLGRVQHDKLMCNARKAGVMPSRYVEEMLDEVPVVMTAPTSEALAAMIRSNAELRQALAAEGPVGWPASQ
jgi:hypothetical protein